MIRKTVVLGLSILLAGATAMACTPSSNATIQAALSKKFAHHKNLAVEVDDCVATFSGEVDSYHDKLDIERQARKHEDLTSVYMKVTIGGPVVEDAKLVETLTWELRRNRNRRGDIFGPFSVEVTNGAVIVTGSARNPMVRDDALDIVADTKGVKDLIDRIKVDPLPEIKMSTPDLGSSRPSPAIFGAPYVGPMVPWPKRP